MKNLIKFEAYTRQMKKMKQIMITLLKLKTVLIFLVVQTKILQTSISRRHSKY